MPRVIKTGRIDPITGQEEVEVAPPNNKKPQENTNENTNIYSPENNNYYNLGETVSSKDNPSKTPLESGKNTGSGVEAALESDGYKWDRDAKKMAENTYQQKVLEEKQGMLTQRQELEKNAQQYQTQADMQKYSDNQTADKVGWTGGYVLDQERQREYMKQSIQAQLYGAMELQKYGYDTAMAAARLSYDANLLNYSQEYYNQAVQNAIAEGNLLGTYFSAEIKEMLQQYTIAGEKLQDSSLSDNEKERAQKIINSINGWFGENNISPAGIKTAAQWSAELAAENQRNELLWEQFNSAMNVANNTKKENSSAFIMLDDKGKPIYDGYTIQMGDWTTIDGKEIVENYLTNDPSGKRRQQFFGYLDTQLTGQSRADFTDWLKANGYTGEEGEILGNTIDLYGEFLGESDVFTNFIEKKFGDLSTEDKKILADTLDGYDLTVNLPDGKTATYTLRIKKESDGSLGNNGTSEQTGQTGQTGQTNQSSQPPKKVLSKTYTKDNQNALLKTLFTTNSDGELINESLKELIKILDGCTQSNPDTWNEDNGWYNGIIKGYGWGGLAVAIEHWAKAGNEHPYEAGQAVEKILEEINVSVGEKNLNLLGDIANKWNNMSDAEKKYLPEKEREYYEQASNFMTKVFQLMEARDYYYRNDSVPFTWSYVGDSWKRLGHQWTHINSFGDVAGAAGQSIHTVFTSVVSGIGGFFWNWFDGTWSD